MFYLVVCKVVGCPGSLMVPLALPLLQGAVVGWGGVSGILDGPPGASAAASAALPFARALVEKRKLVHNKQEQNK